MTSTDHNAIYYAMEINYKQDINLACSTHCGFHPLEINPIWGKANFRALGRKAQAYINRLILFPGQNLLVRNGYRTQLKAQRLEKMLVEGSGKAAFSFF